MTNEKDNQKTEEQKPVLKKKEVSYREVVKEDPEILKRMKFG